MWKNDHSRRQEKIDGLCLAIDPIFQQVSFAEKSHGLKLWSLWIYLLPIFVVIYVCTFWWHWVIPKSCGFYVFYGTGQFWFTWFLLAFFMNIWFFFLSFSNRAVFYIECDSFGVLSFFWVLASCEKKRRKKSCMADLCIWKQVAM